MKPFDVGPDRTLEVPDVLDTEPQFLDGLVLAFDEGRMLVAFDDPEFENTHWLPTKLTGRSMFDSSSEFGMAAIEMPAWICDTLESVFSTHALFDRRREEIARREAEKEAKRKRERRAQEERMGRAAAAAKVKTKAQADFFKK